MSRLKRNGSSSRAETTAGFDAPLPLGRCRNDLALPDVFAQNEQDVLCAPVAGEFDEFFAALDVKLSDRIVEIDQSHRYHRKGDDRQFEAFGGFGNEPDFIFGDAHGFGEDIDGIEADPGDVLQASCGIDPDLVKGAVNDAEFHNVRQENGGRKIRKGFL